MTTELKTETARARSLAGGIGAGLVALGMLIAFIGYAISEQNVIGTGVLAMGLGVFIAICAVAEYLLTARR